ncbi:unnamed protein product [Oikopleura dioica]|uniref:Uncharacterized protein n=1 Tax=Oikopleura dioica TaxID=34765 RepID=E4YR77_OIKDI|nr:unnamed protein product [Oikopleura dioica]
MTSRDLHQAIIDGNFTTGRRYIGRCSMVFRGKKACHVACGETFARRGTTTVQFLESLESNGADLEELDDQGQSLLLLATLNHCDPGPVVTFLKAKFPDLVDKPDKTGRTALHLLGHNKNIIDTEKMMNVMDELFSNVALNAQDELGNTALHYHVANKGALAVEASLKLLRAGADFRLKNKNGQEPLELLESNENLSTKQMDQVKCDLWARMDSEEQSQELKKTLNEMQAEQKVDPEPQKRRGSIFDDLPKTVLKNNAELFSDEPFRKQSCIDNEDTLSGTCESSENESMPDFLESECEADSESKPKSVPEIEPEAIMTEPECESEERPEVFVTECASPEMALQVVCTASSQLPAPILLKEEQFSFSSSLKDSISGSFESIPLNSNSEDEESSPEPSPVPLPKIYSQVYLTKGVTVT